MYRDELGLIVQKNGDGGDTLQRTGFFYLPGIIKEQKGAMSCFENELSILWSSDGPTRHIKQYPNQNEVSRDQLTPVVASLGFAKRPLKVLFLFVRLIKNWFRYPNMTDIASPEHLGIFIRALLWPEKKWFFICLWYPFLLFGDCFMLLGIIIRCIQARNPDDVGDDLNTLVSVVQAQHTFPTPISWLARKLYVKLRPKPYTRIDETEQGNIYLALKWYFREESGGNPEIAVAWKEVCGNL